MTNDELVRRLRQPVYLPDSAAFRRLMLERKEAAARIEALSARGGELPEPRLWRPTRAGMEPAYPDDSRDVCFVCATDYDALRAASGEAWISVKERLPDEWVEVLAYFPHAGEVGIGKWLQRDDGKMWHKDGTSAHESTLPELRFTHWMPLPPAPTDSGEQK